ncbi:LacI family DNA-binding transcriptional regulator [Streptomyces kebangsaanensis]|uniref:LacI family DNA-binding transcriptional regulator n=1 Tax=Streptomyces kebangsaanensis TaxID=864058 RepID=A0ABW6KWY3_9ACTN|nr:LacI family DNA-binding transcriptional regulator [Streptomyces kebangsaanensis]
MTSDVPSPRDEPVTLAAIAARAGVHVSTVSRALTPGANGVSPATAQRIRALAAELGYQRDPAATTLRTGRSSIFGVLVPRLTDFVLARIYEGLDAAAARHGYNTFVANTTDDPALRRERLEELLARRVAGIVLGDARLDGDDLVKILARRNIPYVLVSRRLTGHLSVTTDDLLGGRLAAEHLLQLGHHCVGVAAGEPYASTGVERTTGFVRRYAEAGFPLPPEYVLPSRFDTAGGHAAGAALLDLDPRPTAIFAVNDTAAIGVIGALREHGLRPGSDVAVVGYNDIPVAADMPVPLTTVHSPMFEMGQQAMGLLIDRLHGRRVRSKRLRPHLIARDSTLGD